MSQGLWGRFYCPAGLVVLCSSDACSHPPRRIDHTTLFDEPTASSSTNHLHTEHQRTHFKFIFRTVTCQGTWSFQIFPFRGLALYLYSTSLLSCHGQNRSVSLYHGPGTHAFGLDLDSMHFHLMLLQDCAFLHLISSRPSVCPSPPTSPIPSHECFICLGITSISESLPPPPPPRALLTSTPYRSRYQSSITSVNRQVYSSRAAVTYYTHSDTFSFSFFVLYLGCG